MNKLRAKKIIKNICVAALCCTLAFGMAIPAAAAEAPEISSESAIIIDAVSGQIIYDKDMHKQLHPASITKIMTGILALTYLQPEDVVTASYEALTAVPYDYAKIYLETGEEMTVDQLMYALSVVSANDAANVLAEAVSGTMEDFAKLMTETAASFGAQNTNFVNANGLTDEKHYTSAYDMSLIAKAALDVPGFTTYFSTHEYLCAPTNKQEMPRKFINQNQMVGGEYFYDGTIMSKNGWTGAAQCTLVTAVERDDVKLISVVMKTLPMESTYEDTWALLDYAFDEFGYVTVTGEEIVEALGLQDFEAAEGQEFSFLMSKGDKTSDVVYFVDESLLSPDEDTVTVIASAKLGDMALPDMELMLKRIPPEPEVVETEEPVQTEEPVVATLAPEEPEPEAQDGISAGTILKPALLAIAVVLLIIRRIRRK